MLFPGGFTFTNFLTDVFSIFIFVLWFWLLITVFGDLFRRRDVSGLGKMLWVIVLIVFPYLGVFIYLVSQGRDGRAAEPAGRTSSRRTSPNRRFQRCGRDREAGTAEEFGRYLQ